MINKKQLIYIAIILSIFIVIIPVNAVTNSFYYDTGYDSGEYEINSLTDQASSSAIGENIELVFDDMQQWKGITSAIYYVNFTFSNGWNVRDINIHTSEVPVIYKINDNIVSTGILQFVRHTNSFGQLTGGILTYVFDTPINTDEIGLTHVKCDYVLEDFNFRTIRPFYSSHLIKETNNCPRPYFPASSAHAAQENVGNIDGIAYHRNFFEFEYIYEYIDDSNTGINLNLNRLGYVSRIKLISNNDILTYDVNDNIDVILNNLYDIPYTINVTNPVYIGTGPNEFFEDVIPEDVGIADNVVLSWYAYNKEQSNEIIGTNYILKIRNETDLTWSTQESGYNPSYSDLEIPNNAYYNISLTTSGFEPLENYTFSVSGNKAMNFGLYPEYGANFSVNFQIRDSSGKRIEGAKIILNGITKYTPYNGIIGFGDVSNYINYEITKTNYVPISGNKTITQNEELYIIMYTEEESIITSTITPTPTPDITHPTNLIESIKFALQKMFGLTEFEDSETINLLMGLLIIFGGACLIAGITKDALGAVVGGLIGFVMSLALGFIPMWVLFVGFSGFTIYIILTKTGGSE